MKTILKKLGLAVAMLLPFLPAFAYDFEVDGIYYEVISVPDLTCEVVCGDTKYSGDIVIPSDVVYNGRTFTVTEIKGGYNVGEGAFYKTCIMVVL